jgi:hypothetical protein
MMEVYTGSDDAHKHTTSAGSRWKAQPSSTTESLAPNGDNHLVPEHIFLLQMQCHADDFYLERRASPGALPEIP